MHAKSRFPLHAAIQREERKKGKCIQLSHHIPRNQRTRCTQRIYVSHIKSKSRIISISREWHTHARDSGRPRRPICDEQRVDEISWMKIERNRRGQSQFIHSFGLADFTVLLIFVSFVCFVVQSTSFSLHFEWRGASERARVMNKKKRKFMNARQPGAERRNENNKNTQQRRIVGRNFIHHNRHNQLQQKQQQQQQQTNGIQLCVVCRRTVVHRCIRFFAREFFGNFHFASSKSIVCSRPSPIFRSTNIILLFGGSIAGLVRWETPRIWI